MAVVELPETSSAADAVLARLSSAIDDIHELALSCLDIDQLETLTTGLLRQRERLASATSASVTECDRIALARRRGSHGSTNAHLATFTHGPTASVAPLRTAGLWLLDLPVLADAWQQGVLTHDHIRELKSVDNPRTHQLLARDQQLHVDAATTLEWKQWLNHLAYWLLHADPDGTLPTERSKTYGLTFRTSRTGDVEIKGTLDPLTGEALLTMIDHETNKLRQTEHDNNLTPAEQTPTRQLNTLALMRLCKRGFQRPDGGWPTPLINIVMSEQVAEDLISRMLDGDTHNPFHLPLHYNDIDARCETIRGTPLDPRRTWPALITGRLRRQVMKAKSRKMDVGHDVRLFNEAQKQALLVEARGQCATTGCDSPSAWLQADHINPHTKHGPTNLENGQIKCQPCNLRKGAD